MKVHVVIRGCNNGVDAWEYVVCVTETKEMADKIVNDLNAHNKMSDEVSYFSEEYPFYKG